MGLATLLTVLVFAAPFASAAGITTMTAPYTGWSSTSTTSVSSSGCAAGHQAVAPTWSSTTGMFNYAGRADATSCASSYNYASIYGSTSITSAGFGGTHAGPSYIYLLWNMSLNARAALTFTPGGTFSYASVYLSGASYTYLLDVTNGSTSYITTSTNTLFGASFTSTGLYVLQTGWITSYQYLTAHLLKGHVYELQITIYVTGFVSIYGGTGSGSVVAGLGGTHGLSLTSVTVY
ncbi:MAG TPA: hypothetical protein VIZ68_00295 [Thermoplasmata archaeon]